MKRGQITDNKSLLDILLAFIVMHWITEGFFSISGIFFVQKCTLSYFFPEKVDPLF